MKQSRYRLGVQLPFVTEILGGLLILFVGFVAQAQNGPAVLSQHFKPGDALHYYVRFDGNPEFERLGVQFQTQGEIKKNQESLSQAFDLMDIKKISPGLFEVNGVIPRNVVSGTYRLHMVFVSHAPFSKGYRYGMDFENDVTIDITSDERFEFPKIKSVTPDPPR